MHATRFSKNFSSEFIILYYFSILKYSFITCEGWGWVWGLLRHAGAHGSHSFIVLAVRVDAAGAGSAGSVKRC